MEVNDVVQSKRSPWRHTWWLALALWGPFVAMRLSAMTYAVIGAFGLSAVFTA
jgi:hypothetical protein